MPAYERRIRDSIKSNLSRITGAEQIRPLNSIDVINIDDIAEYVISSILVNTGDLVDIIQAAIDTNDNALYITTEGKLRVEEVPPLSDNPEYVATVQSLNVALQSLTQSLDTRITRPEVQAMFTELVGMAPEALNTIAEIAQQLQLDENQLAVIMNGLATEVEARISGDNDLTQEITTERNARIAAIESILLQLTSHGTALNDLSARSDFLETKGHWEKSGNDLYYTAGKISLGTTTANGVVTIDLAAYGTDAVEIFDSRAPGSIIRFKNGTGGANQFLPLIEGVPVGSARPLGLYSTILPADDIGATPMMLFTGRVGALASTVRPVLGINNGATRLITVDKVGNVGLGIVAPAYKLDIGGVGASNDWVTRGSVYSIAPSVLQPVTLPTSGTVPTDGFAYRLRANVRSGSGIQTGGTWIIYKPSAGNWTIKTVSSAGIVTVHPQMMLDATGNVILYHNSTVSTFTYYVSVEAIYLGASIQVDPAFFGLEADLAYLAGNYGFGVSSPAEKVHVKGKVRLDGTASGSTTIGAAATGGNINYTLPPSSLNGFLRNVDGLTFWASATNSGGAGQGKHISGTHIPGKLYDTATAQTNGMNNFNSAANGRYLTPFTTQETMVIDAIGFQNNASSTSVKFAIYEASANGSPAVLRVETTSQTAAASVVVLHTLNFTFEAGKQYWLQIRTLASILLPTINHGAPIVSMNTAMNSYVSGIQSPLTFATPTEAFFPLDLATMADTNKTSYSNTVRFYLRAA